MSKKISDNCLDLVKEFEGCYLKAYQDEVGVWTIGYGTTDSDKSITGTTIKSGLTITKATALEWLEKSLNQKYLPLVTKYDSVYDWNQNELDALVSFAYNIGSIDQLTAKGTRSRSTIASKMLEYNKAGGVVYNGLTRRRKAEQELFLKEVETETLTAASTDSTSQRVAGVSYFSTLKNSSVTTITKFLHNRGYGAGKHNLELIAGANSESDDIRNSLLEVAKTGKLIKPSGLVKTDGSKFTTSSTVYFSKLTNASVKSIGEMLKNRGYKKSKANIKRIAKANCQNASVKKAMFSLAKKGLLIKPDGLNKR